jgi:hypothetical protein
VNVFHRSVERVSLSRRRARLSWFAALSAAVEKQGCRVTRSSSARRTTSLGAVLLVLALGAAACGSGDDPKTTDDPTETASVTASPTPTTTPTAEPLSPFEDRPQVKALRAWAAAATQDLNARHRDFPAARTFEVDTQKVRKDVAFSFHEDFDKYYPGPLPFTPVAVTGGRRATVSTCVLGAGFALDKPGGTPAEKREVISTVFTMAKEHGTWLLAGIVAGTADCGGVRIKGVQW